MIYTEKPDNFTPKFEITSCFLEHGGEILLLHRQDHKPEGNTWGVPAGKIHYGEDECTAIIREIEEETGHVISPDALRYFTMVYVVFPTYQFVYHMFHVPLLDRPDVQINPDEHKAFAWATPSRALEMNLITDEDPCIRMFYKM